MWLYIIAGVLVAIIAIILIIFYKGYKKVKPDPLKGIPCPPLTHAILGHPERMLHPLKHELRLEVTESARSPLHQLVLMKHASIFINDADEAANVLRDFHSKGKIYTAFRYDAKTPDILASDGPAHRLRSEYLGPALRNLYLKDASFVTKDAILKLSDCAAKGEELDMKKLSAAIGFDCVCKAAFNYDLKAVQGSEDGQKLYKSLCILAESQASQGIYKTPGARSVTSEERNTANADWKAFLLKLVAHIKAETASAETAGTLDTERNFAHAIIQLSKEHATQSQMSGGDDDDVYDDAAILSEVHQILRHGYEAIAGMLQWLTYVLFKVKKVREKLEKAILEHQEEESAGKGKGSGKDTGLFPEYLDCVLKETLRRYPVTGNMTVRSRISAEDEGSLAGGRAEAPVDVPLHVPMFSLQNTTREWLKPKDFVPERWMATSSDERSDPNSTVDDGQAPSSRTTFCHPRCPFMCGPGGDAGTGAAGLSSAVNPYLGVDGEDLSLFSGTGFRPHTLSYFPFSAGPRACPSKSLALQVLRHFLLDIGSRFRLDPVESFWEDDTGVSAHAVILPLNPKTTRLSVRRIVSLRALVGGEAGALEGGVKGASGDVGASGVGDAGDDGWAKEEDAEKDDAEEEHKRSPAAVDDDDYDDDDEEVPGLVDSNGNVQ